MSEVKFYSSKSNAKRAAAKAGINLETAQLLEQDGQFAYVEKVEEVVVEVNLDTLVLTHADNCPHCGICLENGMSDFEGVVEAQGNVEKAFAIMKREMCCLGCGGEWGPLVAAPGTGIKIEKDREERNGLKRPSLGGVCRAVWDACDKVHTEEDGRVITSKEIQALAVVHGWNANNASIEYYNWRKFMGIRGRQAKA